ncbi:hypothetical protein GCM10027456_07460 [Kineosporia babensis]
MVGIETNRGPWVQALIAAGGYQVFAINPFADAIPQRPDICPPYYHYAAQSFSDAPYIRARHRG